MLLGLGALAGTSKLACMVAREPSSASVASGADQCAVVFHRLFEQGAEEQESAAHAELVELLALKVGALLHAAPCAMSEHAWSQES